MVFVFLLLQFVGLYWNISYAENIYEPTAQQLQDQASERDNILPDNASSNTAIEKKMPVANTSQSSEYDNCNWDKSCEAIQASFKCREKYWKPYCDCKDKHWIYLNTNVPFIGRCLVPSSDGSEWINILKALTKILMTFVMIWWFGTIVWWGAQIASGDVGWGKSKIIGVMVAFALLWSLGAILRFINPNFFS